MTPRPTGRLIAACANGKAAVVDARAKRLLALLDIGAGLDAVIMDSPRRRAFIPCGKSGELMLIALDGKAGPRVDGVLKTEIGARTGALDPRTGMVFLPTGSFGPAPAGARRGPLIPGSFHVVAVKP